GSDASVLSRVIETCGVDVELSGGKRDEASLDRALSTGCRRVVIGTAALENPDWVERIIAEHGDRIAIGLDVRGDKLAARGWTREGGDLMATLQRLDAAGCARFVVTDVTSDGMLSGPNFELLGRVCAHTDAAVVASGGVSTLQDVETLTGLIPIGVEGAIIGTALYVGNFTLPDALAVAGGSSVPVSDTAPTTNETR